MSERRRIARNIPPGVAGLFGLMALAGCASGSVEVEGGKPVTVIGETERERFVTAAESGGYPHYEKIYSLIVKQCERPEVESAEADGCLTVRVDVSKQTFDQYGPDDTFVFKSNQTAYPIEENR